MRLEIMDKDNYKVFLNSDYIPYFDIDDNNELGKYIKKIILNIRKIYNITLEGFYEVHVYFIENIGMILEINNIDHYISKTIDLKIIVHNDEEIYLQVPLYETLNNYKNIKYLSNNFYINIDYISKVDFNLIEQYQLIYGQELKKIQKKWIEIN